MVARKLLREEVSVPEAIVRVLEEVGIDMVFGIPGGYAMLIFDALHDHRSIETVAHLLRNAERPVVIAGSGVRIDDARTELVRLSDRLKASVATTVSGKGAFPEVHAMALGRLWNIWPAHGQHRRGRGRCPVGGGIEVGSLRYGPGKPGVHRPDPPEARSNRPRTPERGLKSGRRMADTTYGRKKLRT